MKYPDIFTLEEQKNLRRDQDLLGFGVVGTIISIPYSIYLTSRMKKNPAQRFSYLFRLLTFASLPVFVLIYAGLRANAALSIISSKYFNHLTDYELDNFENYYQMIKS